MQIPRTKFAVTLGLSTDQIIGYEFGRAMVRYDTFAALQRHYRVNPVWLATGDELPRLENFSDEKFREQIKPRELFSSVFDRLLVKYLTMDRINKSGREANLRLVADWSDPRVLARLRQAREAAGVSLEYLAATISAACRTKITAKALADYEAGKKVLNNIGLIADWKHELGVNEMWLYEGDGEMFENPLWKEPGYLARLQSARTAAGLTLDELATRLTALTTARVTGTDLARVEAGAMMTTGSLRLGFPHVLGIASEDCFPHVRKQAAPKRSVS